MMQPHIRRIRPDRDSGIRRMMGIVLGFRGQALSWALTVSD